MVGTENMFPHNFHNFAHTTTQLCLDFATTSLEISHNFTNVSASLCSMSSFQFMPHVLTWISVRGLRWSMPPVDSMIIEEVSSLGRCVLRIIVLNESVPIWIELYDQSVFSSIGLSTRNANRMCIG